jgi:hypothetical protein
MRPQSSAPRPPTARPRRVLQGRFSGMERAQVCRDERSKSECITKFLSCDAKEQIYLCLLDRSLHTDRQRGYCDLHKRHRYHGYYVQRRLLCVQWRLQRCVVGIIKGKYDFLIRGPLSIENNMSAIAACAPVANATAVTCTTATDSEATTCASGTFVSNGACAGVPIRKIIRVVLLILNFRRHGLSCSMCAHARRLECDLHRPG